MEGDIRRQLKIVNVDRDGCDLTINDIDDDGEIIFTIEDYEGNESNVYMKATKKNIERIMSHFDFLLDSLE